jgi:hypothetical protein
MTAAALTVDGPLPYDGQRSIELAVERIVEHTMVTFPGLAATYRTSVFCEQAGIPGDFVECGVWKGGCAGLMAIANREHGAAPRPLHLFDAFEDIVEPDETVDGERAVKEAREFAGVEGPLTGRLAPMEGFYSHLGGPGSQAIVEDLLVSKLGYDAGHVHVHAGYFQDTLPVVAPGIDQIAVLRLDGDWYASTKVCLEHLFDKVAPGGFVIVDDYGIYDGCRHAVDEFFAERGERHFLHHVNYAVRYLQKR